MFDDEPDESERDESPAAPEPEEPEGAPAEEQPAAAEDGGVDETVGEDRAEEQPAAEEEPVSEEPPAAERADARREGRGDGSAEEPEAIPGAHLEPDLVLEEPAAPEAEYGDPAEEPEVGAATDEDGAEAEAPAPVATFLELAADARYRATGKRKTAVARVILKPGSGEYTVNGRPLAEFFPRPTLQRTARGPLETVGQTERMDVVAKIHGGGVSAQAGALRHGIARALVEADPNLRGELKRRGFLTRDPRVKERKKAGLKKARKRPQFSKR